MNDIGYGLAMDAEFIGDLLGAVGRIGEARAAGVYLELWKLEDRCYKASSVLEVRVHLALDRLAELGRLEAHGRGVFSLPGVGP